MKITAKQYAQALFELVKDQPQDNLPSILDEFVKLLIAHNQINRIARIIEHFKTLWNKEYDIIEAEIVSANKLEKEVETLLKEYIKLHIKAKELSLTTKIDKKLLGGFILRYGDHILDASIKNRVKDLEYIMNN